MSLTPEEHVTQWANLFDHLSSSYDQTGVPFFSVIAEGLVQRLAPVAGERALDVGVGRGAVTFPLADAVGPHGSVDAIDIAPGMVQLTTQAVRDRGLDHVHVQLGDAADPRLTPGTYDLIAASLMMFFLPEPERSLPRWVALLRPGARLGVSTFRPWHGHWQEIETVFDDHLEDTGRPSPTSMPEVFRTDEGVAGLLSDAGLHDVRTAVETFVIPFEDAEEWRVWSLGTAMRGLWLRTPQDAHPHILERVAAILEESRGVDGRMGLEVDVRYTVGRRA